MFHQLKAVNLIQLKFLQENTCKNCCIRNLHYLNGFVVLSEMDANINTKPSLIHSINFNITKCKQLRPCTSTRLSKNIFVTDA